MQIVSKGDDLHEISKPVFLENIYISKCYQLIHFENKPVQIYREFHLQKLKFSDKR